MLVRSLKAWVGTGITRKDGVEDGWDFGSGSLLIKELTMV